MNQYKTYVKEYMGDRPCIEPMAMSELRVRCYYNQPKTNLWQKLIQMFN